MSRAASNDAASCGCTPAVKNTDPGCDSAIARARAAVARDSPMQIIARAPLAAARATTSSRSASNAGSARCAWLSMNSMAERREPPRPRRFSNITRGGSALSPARDRTLGARATPLLGHGAGCPFLLAARGARPFALDPEEQRACDIDRAERAGENSERHDPGEWPNHLTGEQEEGERGGERRRMRQHGPGQRLVDRAIQDVAQRLLALLAQVLTNAIENDDR